MASTFAAGETILGVKVKPSFTEVPVDAAGNIETKTFLDAAEALTVIFDEMGSMAFTPVKNDILGNVKKLREYYNAHQADAGTVQALVAHERGPAKPKKIPTATEGLLWLTRGLEFTCLGLTKNISSTDELSASFRDAYGSTLKPHHGIMVRPVFSAAMSAVPYRKDFYLKLGSDEDTVKGALGPYLEALTKIVEINKALLAQPENKY